MSVNQIHALYRALREDHRREVHGFSPDIREAHALVHLPFVWEDEIADTMQKWCKSHQPCQFGRVVATNAQVHFCILTDEDIQVGGDEGIRKKIAEEKRLWKQRAVDDRVSPPHSFMLVLVSPRVALAAPDDSLYRFACHLRDLAGWSSTETDEVGNPVMGDYLYLRHPEDGYYYGFKYNIDFFASAGDGRWWQDHRVPGGLAFTANATGHMRHFQEWYSEKGQDRGDWFLTQAMKTISHAQPFAPTTQGEMANVTSQPDALPHEGRVTWLRDLVDGKPLKNSACPFHGTVPKSLQEKDWTVYEGLLHTDHNIREEFFEDRETPSTSYRPYIMDFTYLYEKRESDFVKFMAGIRVAERDVYAEIGSPETWRTRSGGDDARPKRTQEQDAEIRRLQDVIEQWTDGFDSRQENVG